MIHNPFSHVVVNIFATFVIKFPFVQAIKCSYTKDASLEQGWNAPYTAAVQFTDNNNMSCLRTREKNSAKRDPPALVANKVRNLKYSAIPPILGPKKVSKKFSWGKNKRYRIPSSGEKF